MMFFTSARMISARLLLKDSAVQSGHGSAHRKTVLQAGQSEHSGIEDVGTGDTGVQTSLFSLKVRGAAFKSHYNMCLHFINLEII